MDLLHTVGMRNQQTRARHHKVVRARYGDVIGTLNQLRKQHILARTADIAPLEINRRNHGNHPFHRLLVVIDAGPEGLAFWIARRGGTQFGFQVCRKIGHRAITRVIEVGQKHQTAIRHIQINKRIVITIAVSLAELAAQVVAQQNLAHKIGGELDAGQDGNGGFVFKIIELRPHPVHAVAILADQAMEFRRRINALHQRITAYKFITQQTGIGFGLQKQVAFELAAGLEIFAEIRQRFFLIAGVAVVVAQR